MIKTFTDIDRFDLNLDRYAVYEVLPSQYDELYPNLANFLKAYYESLEQDGNPAKLVNDLLTNRDIVSVQQEFLGFLSNELLLGKPYFQQFKDKRTALQFSNLLYRSKGTEYSIQQFFRIFYNVDVDVTYGRDFIFNVGEPIKDHLEFSTQGSFTGSTFQYTFSGSPVSVYTKPTANDSDEWLLMRQDVDYIQNFFERRIEFLHRDLDDKNVPKDGYGYVVNSLDEEQNNPFYVNLAETGFLGTDDSDSQVRLKIITDLNRNNYSAIGAEVTQKKLTNDKFIQLFAIMIQAPISVNVWKESYKTFVHPAGMYLEGRVQITSVAKLKLKTETIINVPEVSVIIPAKVFKGTGVARLNTDITERAPGPYGYEVRTRLNDMVRDELHNANYKTPRLLIGSRDSDSSVAGWGREYNWMNRADDINSRTLDDTYLTLSNTINTLDENIYTGQDSDGSGNPWLPGNIDSRPPIPTPPINKTGEGEIEADRSSVVGVAEVEADGTGIIRSGPSTVVGAATSVVSYTYLTSESNLIIITEDSDGLIL